MRNYLALAFAAVIVVSAVMYVPAVQARSVYLFCSGEWTCKHLMAACGRAGGEYLGDHTEGACVITY